MCRPPTYVVTRVVSSYAKWAHPVNAPDRPRESGPWAKADATVGHVAHLRRGRQRRGADPGEGPGGGEPARLPARYDKGAAAAAQLCREGPGPDAILCANDLIALGARDTLRHRLGGGVPEDVLVAGFDDNPAAAWAAYRLTSFVQGGAAWPARPWPCCRRPPPRPGRSAGAG